MSEDNPSKLDLDASNTLESKVYEVDPEIGAQSRSWFKLGVVAAASVALGGIATAWWYRKTLKKLRETGEIDKNPHFGMRDEKVDVDAADGI